MTDLPGWAREILRCPACHGELTDGAASFTCAACDVTYPVVDGVPVLLVEDGGAA